MTIAYENGVNLFDTAEVYSAGKWVWLFCSVCVYHSPSFFVFQMNYVSKPALAISLTFSLLIWLSLFILYLHNHARQCKGSITQNYRKHNKWIPRSDICSSCCKFCKDWTNLSVSWRSFLNWTDLKVLEWHKWLSIYPISTFIRR